MPQSKHEDDPLDEYDPSLQISQTLEFVAASTEEEVPSSQLVHCETGVSDAYLPLGQARQVVSEEAPIVSEYLPIEHLEHTLEAQQCLDQCLVLQVKF